MNQDLDIVGFPSTVMTWLVVFDVVKINPLVTFIVSIMSLVWLSLQIYGWIEKRIKKNGKES
jgi:hypothetical protein